MYQTSIRNKKKISQFNKVANNNYIINPEYEVYAYVIKLLGNCRVLVLCDNGTEAVGVIRGSMRRFNKRVLIETGDILAVSMRDFQDNKVDIVHKYNAEQCKILINNKEISDTLINAYNKISNNTVNNANEASIIFDDAEADANADADANKKNASNKASAATAASDYNNSEFVFNSEDDDDDANAEADDANAEADDANAEAEADDI
jgi:translation initiation factor 1A